jgi:hypothetical protein
MPLLRIRNSAAALCYGVAWLSMVALTATLTIAEILQPDARAEISSDSRDAGSVAHLHIVRRIHR